jgi:hypothetical protein
VTPLSDCTVLRVAILATLLVTGCTPPPKGPHLSATEVLRLAEAEARETPDYDPERYQPREARYLPEDRQWAVPFVLLHEHDARFAVLVEDESGDTSVLQP